MDWQFPQFLICLLLVALRKHVKHIEMIKKKNLQVKRVISNVEEFHWLAETAFLSVAEQLCSTVQQTFQSLTWTASIHHCLYRNASNFHLTHISLDSALIDAIVARSPFAFVDGRPRFCGGRDIIFNMMRAGVHGWRRHPHQQRWFSLLPTSTISKSTDEQMQGWIVSVSANALNIYNGNRY